MVKPPVGLVSACSISMQLCLQGEIALGEHEGGGWERTLAAELLGSSTSQSLRLIFNGSLPQTLAGSTGESLHVCPGPSRPAMP